MRAVAEINLANLLYNLNEIKKCVKPETNIMAVVKANAYGHGAVKIANFLESNGVNMFGVATMKEAVTLREHGITASILDLDYFEKQELHNIFMHDIIQTIFRYDCAKALSDYAKQHGKTAKIHIKVDTGMNRLGFKCDDNTVDEIMRIYSLPNIALEGIFTHLATADEKDKTRTLKQIERFEKIINELENEGVSIKYKHVLNTAGAIDFGMQYGMGFVRCGIALYGLYPSEEVNINKINLKQVMALKSKIIHLKEIEIGEAVGYGATYTAVKKTKVATLPIGYADGYNRKLSNKGRALVRGQYANVIGRICMDQMMLDVTDIDEVSIGDEVVLIGEQGDKKISIDEIAQLVDTINYEIVCGISERVERKYLEGEQL